MSTIGDKIGLLVPTDQSDLNTWGSTVSPGLNGEFFVKADEFFYAAREDRNLVILGGGKISWDSATGNLTFTSQIEIYGHITAFKNIISTAASPTTLNAALKTAYAQFSRKPAVDNTITALTVVANGSLPNGTTDSDMGTFVIAFRTNDSTVILPWARRELLSGDFWQYGTALSWYERIAMNHKPAFRSNPADSSQLVVEGSATAPAVVNIDGKLYANTSNVTLDLDTAGRNGLDTGAKAASTLYYLYAIPPTSGRTFDVVCSVTAPTGAGPTGFSSWSYIGSFSTIAASALPNFQYIDGVFMATAEVQTVLHNTTTRTLKSLTQMPSFAKRAYLEASCIGSTLGGGNNVSGADNTNDSLTIFQQVNGVTIGAWGWVSMPTAQSIWLTVSNATNTLTVELYGWHEDVMAFK